RQPPRPPVVPSRRGLRPPGPRGRRHGAAPPATRHPRPRPRRATPSTAQRRAGAFPTAATRPRTPSRRRGAPKSYRDEGSELLECCRPDPADVVEVVDRVERTVLGPVLDDRV